MKKVKVILLRGTKDSGKTHTMNYVLLKLLSKPAYTFFDNESETNDLTRDREAIVVHKNNKKIGILTHSDVVKNVKGILEWFFKEKVVLIVGATRSRNKTNSVYEFYEKLVQQLTIQIVYEVWTEKAENKAQQTKNQHKVAGKIVDKIEEIINAQGA